MKIFKDTLHVSENGDVSLVSGHAEEILVGNSLQGPIPAVRIKAGTGASNGYNGDSYPYVIRQVSPSGRVLTVERVAVDMENATDKGIGGYVDAPGILHKPIGGSEKAHWSGKEGRYKLGSWGFYPGRALYRRNPHF